MEIKIERIAKKQDYTIGALSINRRWVCNTLEPHCIDWAAENKVAGKTAIPEGRYKVEMCFSPKFNRLMPYLVGVPHFSGVMIHQGNTPKNTQGCILVGSNTIRGLVLKSKAAMDKITAAIRYARGANQEIWCEII